MKLFCGMHFRLNLVHDVIAGYGYCCGYLVLGSFVNVGAYLFLPTRIISFFENAFEVHCIFIVFVSSGQLESLFFVAFLLV